MVTEAQSCGGQGQGCAHLSYMDRHGMHTRGAKQNLGPEGLSSDLRHKPPSCAS